MPQLHTLPARAHASTQLLYYALLIQCPIFLKESCILCGGMCRSINALICTYTHFAQHIEYILSQNQKGEKRM